MTEPRTFGSYVYRDWSNPSMTGTGNTGRCLTCHWFGLDENQWTFRSEAALDRWVTNHYQWHRDNPDLGRVHAEIP